MSHIVSIATEIRDRDALAAACRRLGVEEPTHGTATLFSGQATGWLVKLPDWLYPVVVDPASARVQFDNYEGSWGNPADLDHLLQAYAVEKATAPRCTSF